MLASGVAPSTYLETTRFRDAFGRAQVVFKDSGGHEISISTPSRYRIAALPSFDEPQVITPWIRIGNSAEPLRFSIGESSDFAEIWRGYPKRRSRISEEDKEDLPN